jgi:hypothetical protein
MQRHENDTVNTIICKDIVKTFGLRIFEALNPVRVVFRKTGGCGGCVGGLVAGGDNASVPSARSVFALRLCALRFGALDALDYTDGQHTTNA